MWFYMELHFWIKKIDVSNILAFRILSLKTEIQLRILATRSGWQKYLLDKVRGFGLVDYDISYAECRYNTT